MKKYVIVLWAWLLTVGSVKTVAQTDEMQDIVVTNFQRVVTDLTASMNPVMDNNGDACAVLKFSVRDTTFVIEPNLGYLRRESKVGEIRLWVPARTKRLTVRHEGMFPLRDYTIPCPIESKAAYHAYLWCTTVPEPPRDPELPRDPEPKPDPTPTKVSEPTTGGNHTDGDTIQPPQPKKPSKTHFYFAPGYLITPQSGLSLTMGIKADHEIVEMGAAMALSKTDSLHYYKNTTWRESYQYRLLKVFLRLGHEFRTKGNVAFSCSPLLGVQGALTFGSGGSNEYIYAREKNMFKDGMAVSVSAALRLGLCVGKHFAWYVKPEYDIAVYKSDSYKMMIQGNDTFKKWAEGFALDTGVMVTF